MQALVVDDSRAMRSVLDRILTNLGYTVTQASDGAEALVLLNAGMRPDVMLVDWNMPVMDGLSFVKTCHARPEWSGIPMMMVTTESEQDQIERALAAGAMEYLIKPFTPECVAEKLTLLGLEVGV